MMASDLIAFFAQYAQVFAAAWIALVIFVFGRSALFFFGKYVLKIKKGETTLQSRVVDEIKTPYTIMLLTMCLYYIEASLALLPAIDVPLGGSMTFVIVLFGVYIARKALHATITWYGAKDKRRLNIEQTALMSLKTLINFFIYATAAIIVLNQFGVEITPLLASLGIGGIAIALALQTTLSNYFAGVYIASDKTARIGDFIELEGITTAAGEPIQGYVERMTWRSVWIRTYTNNMIVVPNSKISESIIMNYDQPRQPMLFKIPVSVAYSSDLQKVEEVTLKVAKKVAKETGATVDEEEPYVRFTNFGESNIDFSVYLKIKRWDFRFLLKHAFIKELIKEYDKERIEISFPCTNIYMRAQTAAESGNEDGHPPKTQGDGA